MVTIQVQFDREKSASRLKDQASDFMEVPVHLQNGRRVPHVHDGQLYHRPFENGAVLKPEWRNSSFQTPAAADKSTSRTGTGPYGTSSHTRTRRPEFKPTIRHGQHAFIRYSLAVTCHGHSLKMRGF